MRVSMKWLTELVDVTLPVPELVDVLDMSGTAVEAVHATGEALDNVVVGLIAEKVRHPEADKLWVTKVDVGGDEPRTIVCGAQNFEAGDKVPVALVGAVLPGGFEIKKAKLRGVVSEGMNCSARELGLGEDHEGLMILPPDAPVGMPFAQYQGLSDVVLELEVTPNRPDCLSMAGVAREVGAVLSLPAKMPSQSPTETGTAASDSCTVRIEDPELCPRYTARIIRGVKVGPSPQWLVERIVAAGARPINNIVDITNYVLFELGQPLHAFDLDTLAAEQGRASIIVRRAREVGAAAHPRWCRARAEPRHARDLRSDRPGRTRRRHGRRGDRGLGCHRQRSARVGELRPRFDQPHEPLARPGERGVDALRAHGGSHRLREGSGSCRCAHRRAGRGGCRPGGGRRIPDATHTAHAHPASCAPRAGARHRGSGSGRRGDPGAARLRRRGARRPARSGSAKLPTRSRER